MKNFYEQDGVSIQTLSKKNCIIKKQKRYVCNSLRLLHEKFCNESNFAMNYATFCKLRPFWVIDIEVSEWDMCLCKKYENISLFHTVLKTEEVLQDNLSLAIEKGIYCEKSNVYCYFRKCSGCFTKYVVMNEF